MSSVYLKSNNRFYSFLKSFNNGNEVFIEDSVLWYCLDIGVDFYLSLSVNERINFKQSYF